MVTRIQLLHIPEALHRRLKARAALAGMPLSDFLLRELEKIAEQPTQEEMLQRLNRRATYAGRISPTALIREERGRR